MMVSPNSFYIFFIYCFLVINNPPYSLFLRDFVPISGFCLSFSESLEFIFLFFSYGRLESSVRALFERLDSWIVGRIILQLALELRMRSTWSSNELSSQNYVKKMDSLTEGCIIQRTSGDCTSLSDLVSHYHSSFEEFYLIILDYILLFHNAYCRCRMTFN